MVAGAARAALHTWSCTKLIFWERERKTEKGVSVSSGDNENKAGTMPSTGGLPKHISLAWASYKQGNEKHMLESKVRSEGLWVSDSRPKTFPLFFSCGLPVSDVTLTAFISHDGQAYFGLLVFCCVSFFPSPNGSYWEEEENRQERLCHFFPTVMGK